MDRSLSSSSTNRRRRLQFDKKVDTNPEPEFSTVWKQEAFRMQLRCGGLDQAEKLFAELQSRDALQFTLLISALVKAARFREAVTWFRRMQLEGTKPDRVCFIAVLGAYAGIGDLDEAKSIHGVVYRSGYEGDTIVGTSIVTLYAKCGSLRNASLMFRRISHISVVSWNAIITAYAQSGEIDRCCDEVIGLFREMCSEGIAANQVTFVSLLNACVGPAMADELRRLHGLVIESGFERELIVQTALIKAYGRANLPGDARGIFDGLTERDIVAWNTMVAAYEAAGMFSEAVQLFWEIRIWIRPNRISFVAVLRACAGLRDFAQTRMVHGFLNESGMDSDAEVQAELLDAYVACGSAGEALAVFRGMESPPLRCWISASTAAQDAGVFRVMMLEGAIATINDNLLDTNPIRILYAH